jgi:tetratricopeptide (TPR) repeat protein
MKRVLIFLSLISFIFCDETLFKKANEEYLNKNYEKALEYYHQIINNNTFSVALYFNMGNCYYKLSKPGYAVLYYEKALKYAPSDEDIKENLAIVNAEIVDKFEVPEQLFIFDLYNTVKYSLSSNQYLIAIVIFFFLILISILIKRFFREKLGSNLITLFSVFLVISLFFTFIRLSENESTHAILLQEQSEVYSSPSAENQAFILHEGAKFELIRESNGFYEISTIDGKTGWISENDIGKI